LGLVETYYIAYPHGLCLNPGSFRSRRPRRPPSTAQRGSGRFRGPRRRDWHCLEGSSKARRLCSKNAAASETQNLNSRFFFFKARPQHYAICSAKNALLCGSPSRPHQPGGSRFLRAKCFDITRRAVDAIAQHQRHLCDATRCRRRCSTTTSTSAGSSPRRRSGASARNGDANALHARLRRDGSSVVSVALEPTACSSARLELPPEVVSGSVLVASAQFVSARRFDVAAPRFEARPSRRRRRKDEELLGAFGSAT